MLRVFATIVVPLLLPTAIYIGWIWLARPGMRRDTVWPWLWLGGAGVLLLAIVLFGVTVHFGKSEPGVYVPPRWENGKIVPGHIEPATSR